METRPLEVVFLTNFTDFCYRCIPAIAQMADDFAMRLTIVYATLDRTPSVEDRTKLESFFPEADAYARTRRMTLKGDPLDAVKRLSLMHPVDLLIAPAADPLGLPRFWHRSLRARLLREARIPLWTIDRRTHPEKLRRAPKRVGCWIDFHPRWRHHVAYAREYASVVGAELHVLHAIPEITEGLGARDDEPLSESGVIEAVTKAVGPSPVPMKFHVAENDSARTRRKLLDDACVDLVFAAEMNSRLPWWLAPKPRLMNECLCPVVHVPVDSVTPVWQMTKPRTLEVVEPVYTMALRR